MPANAPSWTADLVRALPDDGRRYELVSGVLVVTPAPKRSHQVVVGEFHVALHAYLKGRGIGEVLFSPADLSLGEDEVLQPDLFVYPTPAGRRTADWPEITELLLVVEVLSPSTRRYDRTLKRRRYQRAGVPEYWVVDPDHRQVERWRPGDTQPETLTRTLTWHPAGADTPLVLDLAALFREALGEPDGAA